MYFNTHTHTHSLAHTELWMHVMLQRGNTALQLASDNGKSEVAEVVCKHGARGALWCAARFDLRDMLAELISKGHDLEECDKVHFSCS